ncbi:MAG: DNA mismatch repair protein MutS [Bdellovibrionota bacterium]
MSLSVSPGRESLAWKTPLYEQFWRLKDEAPQAILFFRLGDFYELFGDDAILAAPILEVQLTARNKNHPDPIPMCGIPVHALENYVEKIIAQGHKIAIADQVEETGEGNSKKIVDRKIVRILTPGLPIDFERLNGREPHWLVSMARKPRSNDVDVLVFDLLGSKLFEGSLETPNALADLLQRLAPKEILIESTWLADPLQLKNWGLDPEGQAFRKCHWTAWGTNDARKNLEEYLAYTQRLSHEALERLLPEAKGLSGIAGARHPEYAHVSQNVLEQWAVFPELFEILDSCGSVVGSRRLRQILARPLASVSRIRERQLVFKDGLDEQKFFQDSREVYDFERLLGRFRIGVAQPLELLRFRTSLGAALSALAEVKFSSEIWKACLRSEELVAAPATFAELKVLFEELKSSLKEDVEPRKGILPVELVRIGFDAEFDRLQALNVESETWLENYEERLRAETHIPSLKVRSNRVFGYYIDVTKTHLAKIPESFERKQTTVQGERFSTPELREREREILTAASRAEARALKILGEVTERILTLDKTLHLFVELFGLVDAMAGVKRSIKTLAAYGAWTIPQVESAEHVFFEIEEARHPILEALYQDFIPNSLSLDTRSERLLLLTGPNMAGKSTLMRQTGLCLLLAQCGFLVPARSMRFVPCSGFFSRMGASDRILAGESTFMVEMKETAAILREADEKSFVLIDEIGRGTSTTDGLSIARAVLEHLHDRVKALCIFATHYHELSEDAARLPQAFNASMGIREWKGDLVFLRKLVREAAQSSYGLYVAKWAGLPQSLLSRAQKELERLSALEKVGSVQKDQMSLFANAAPTSRLSENDKIIEGLRAELDTIRGNLLSVEMDDLAPRGAWDKLREIQLSLKD